MGLVKKKHKSGTPGPSASSFNYSDTIFVYASASNKFWKKAQDIGKSNISYSESLLTKDNYGQAGAALISMGKTERETEKQLLTKILKRYFPNSTINLDALDRVAYVKLLNNLLVGEKKYNENLMRLQGLYDAQQKEIDSWKKDKKNEGKNSPVYHGYAPSISSLMLNIFRASCRDVSYSMINKAITSGKLDYKAWQDKIKEAFFQTLTSRLEKNKGGQYKYLGGLEQWEKTINILKEMDDFTETLMVQGSAKSIHKEIQSKINQYKNNSNQFIKKDIRNIINNNITVKGTRSATYGGYAGEFVNIAQILENFMGLTGGNIVEGTITESGCQIQGKVFENNMMKIDNMVIVSFGAECSYSANDLNEYMNNNQPENLKEAHDYMTQYFEKNKPISNDSFIIFQNAKTSGLGSSFKGFKGDSGKLADIPDISNDFLTVIANAAEKGIFQSKAKQLIEALKIFILRKVAALLFDDVEVVGNQNGGNRIHVLNLNNIIVPMSDVLTLAGEAMQKMMENGNLKDLQSYFNVTVNLGTASKTTKEAEGGNSDRDRKQNIIRLWEDNYQEVIDGSTYNVYMMRGFNDYMSQFMP